MKMLLISLTIDIVLFLLVSVKAGIIGLSIIFLKFVYDLGLFSSIKFYRGNLPQSEIFYLEYQGMYRNIGDSFGKLNTILNKFKLDDNENYSTFGIYYDSPSKVVDQNKCRAIVGIRRINTDLNKSLLNKDVGSEFEYYMLNNDFKKAVLPDTVCLTASFAFIYMISMIIGIQKFYSALTTNLKSEEFRRQYGIKHSNFAFSVEIYDKNEIKFFIPNKNQDKFTLSTIPAPEYKA